MSKRNCHPPHHESPHEQRLREIVEELVPEDYQKDAYVAFARELMLAERRSARQDNSECRMQISDCRIGGSANEAVKRIVAKWFERGLQGRLLWRIGEAILDRE